MYYIEHKFEDNVRCLRYQGISNPCIWLHRGGNVLINIYLSNYGISETIPELNLICLLKY